MYEVFDKDSDVNPALAIAEIMKANYPDCEIAFVGTPDGLENDLVPQAGYKLYKIKIPRFRGILFNLIF